MESMQFENVGKVLLSHPNIHYAKYEGPDFRRTFAFSVKGNFYSIVWYRNIMTLYFNGGGELKFASFELSGTWPNRARWNLQFYDDRGETVCIIPVEEVRDEVEVSGDRQQVDS